MACVEDCATCEITVFEGDRMSTEEDTIRALKKWTFEQVLEYYATTGKLPDDCGWNVHLFNSELTHRKFKELMNTTQFGQAINRQYDDKFVQRTKND